MASAAFSCYGPLMTVWVCARQHPDCFPIHEARLPLHTNEKPSPCVRIVGPQGDQIHAELVGASGALLRAWATAHQQCTGREGHPPLCGRQKSLAVQQQPRRGSCLSGDVHPDRNSQGKRNRTVRLPVACHRSHCHSRYG